MHTSCSQFLFNDFASEMYRRKRSRASSGERLMAPASLADSRKLIGGKERSDKKPFTSYTAAELLLIRTGFVGATLMYLIAAAEKQAREAGEWPSTLVAKGLTDLGNITNCVRVIVGTCAW